jgi:hypothetical protein
MEPYYLPPPDAEAPDFQKMRVDCEVLRTSTPGVNCKWYYALADDAARGIKKDQLLGFEVSQDRDDDPCEVTLLDYQPIGGGRQMPTRMVVRYKDDTYLQFNGLTYQLDAAK